ncbi:cyanophycinase [Rheinheimera sp. A13L]|uniref:cyanophycinase n=1 Tax=Rheinheimera sp. A13L TaxID=506534 RepID=UPI0002124BA0|nr:cyanophycinase [Rheinheimera sp. A13L]EGM79045.1 cyanophycinase [Rheinheimera sp. A13L]
MKKDCSTTVEGPRTGHLVIIGGKENRKSDMVILERFVALAGGPDANIFVLTAASDKHDEMWSLYENAFTSLGVRQVTTSNIKNREDACGEAIAARISEADGIFMTGGDQKRLMALIGGTRIDHAMHSALRQRGACIGGTSAGASAMSEHMLFNGSNDLLPQKGSVHLGAGLGLVRRVIIDQHFSERQRLGRLLSAVAQNPYLLGAGIDENTALIVRPGQSIEVIGDGAVTLIDGREMLSNFTEVKNSETLELADVRLHLLPAGVSYDLASFTQEPDKDETTVPLSPGLGDAIAAVTSWCGLYRESTEQKTAGESL